MNKDRDHPFFRPTPSLERYKIRNNHESLQRRSGTPGHILCSSLPPPATISSIPDEYQSIVFQYSKYA